MRWFYSHTIWSHDSQRVSLLRIVASPHIKWHPGLRALREPPNAYGSAGLTLAPADPYGPCAGPWGHSPRGPTKIRKKSKIENFRFLKISKTHQITHESTILTPDSSPARRADTFRGVCHFLRFDFWWSHGQFTFWHFCVFLLLGLSSARAPAQWP